ncbi:MAG TPA: ATP synthase F1 subunit delta [Gemmatimonadaceae bacterium]|nr:ATP synthase F1 subunit delta [Gemmatimonadaceae bacterium]
MHDASIARNYAEALLELARKAGEPAVEEWGGLVHALAAAVESDTTLRRFLEAPQVSAAQKSRILARGLEGRAPAMFIRFVQKLVSNRRQLLIPAVATAYTDLVDAAAGRVHARLTFARAVSDADRDAIAAQLSKVLSKTVVPHTAVSPAILGGVVVRVGDTVMDGSVRRRLDAVRARMLGLR